MATLAELLAEVNSNTDTVSCVTDQESADKISVSISYKTGSVGMSLRRWVFIKDKGLAGEKAYWDGGKPSYLTSADSFPGDLATELVAYQTANPTYEKYQIINTFASEKYAIVKFYFWGGSATSTIKNMLFWKQGANWFVRELV